MNIIPIGGLKDLTDKDCCIVGTVFKEMELKPSILKEISQQVKQLISLKNFGLQVEVKEDGFLISQSACMCIDVSFTMIAKHSNKTHSAIVLFII